MFRRRLIADMKPLDLGKDLIAGAFYLEVQ